MNFQTFQTLSERRNGGFVIQTRGEACCVIQRSTIISARCSFVSNSDVQDCSPCYFSLWSVFEMPTDHERLINGLKTKVIRNLGRVWMVKTEQD